MSDMLSDHYNCTRGRYYQVLARASRGKYPVEYLIYAARGVTRHMGRAAGFRRVARLSDISGEGLRQEGERGCVPRPDRAEMVSIQCCDAVRSQALSAGNDGSVDRDQWEVSVLCDQR
jgi:hypothetical protein